VGKTKYTSELKDRMLALYREGKTDAGVAKAVGISVRTIHHWKSKNVALLHSIKEAKGIADDRVETMLYLMATGHSYYEEKTFRHGNKRVRVKVLKHRPPDTTAMIFWLKNRRRDRWK